MTADEFVARVEQVAPSIEELMDEGLSRESAVEFQKSYVCPRKPGNPNPQDGNPLLDLLARYDTSALEIGMITLKPESWPKSFYDKLSKDNKTLVGSLESDPLVINRSTGAIENLDHEDLKFVVARCAASGSQFLDALCLVAAFKQPHPVLGDAVLSRDQEMENYEAALAQAEQCAQAAGISEPGGGIYATLLGAWEPE